MATKKRKSKIKEPTAICSCIFCSQPCIAIPRVLNAWKVWDKTFPCGMGGIQFTFTASGAPTNQPALRENCILNERELPWCTLPHVASNWDKKREKSIEWGVQEAGGRERSSRLTVIAPHLGPLALLPPITNCTLDPTTVQPWRMYTEPLQKDLLPKL